MLRLHPFYRLGITLVLLFLFLANANGQSPAITGSTITPIPGVGRDYTNLMAETVDPASGSVSLRISLPVPLARGLAIPFAFTYNSNSVALQQGAPGSPAWNYSQSMFGVGPWSNTLPQLSAVIQGYSKPGTMDTCYSSTGYTFQDSNGVAHPLGLSAYLVNPNININPSCGSTNWTNYFSGGDDYVQAILLGVSGTGSILYPSYGAGVGVVQVADASGTVYTFGNTTNNYWDCSDQPAVSGPQIVNPIAYALPSTIEDRNGNIITLSNPCASGSPLTISDTTGRTALTFNTQNAYPPHVLINSVTVSGISNPYSVTRSSVSGTQVSVNATLVTGDSSCHGVPAWNNFNLSQNAGYANFVSAITLPNEKQYQFAYDPTYGLLSQITYPTGGYVKYVWEMNHQSASVAYANTTGQAYYCQYIYDKPALLHRYVSYDGSTIALQQDFSYSTTWSGTSWATKQTTVTTHDLVRGTSFQTIYTYSPVLSPTIPNSAPPGANFEYWADRQLPVESTIVYKSISGGTLKTVNKGWSDPYEMTCEVTTWDNGQVSGTFYGWGPGHVITDKREYDFGILSSSACTWSTATPTRETVTNYQSFAVTPIFPTAPSILNRESSVFTYGNGTLAAETVYSYDQVAVGSLSNLPSGTHDETYYSSSSTAPRGNATTVTRKCLQSCTDSTTTYTFDETGQVLTTKDPCGNATCTDITGTNHTTNYSYADNYDSNPSSNTNAFLTTITDQLGHTVNYKYAYADGQLISITDANGLMASYLYADPLRRLTETDRPDGGSTKLAYNDTAPTPSVTTSEAINTQQTKTTVLIKDGMGHAIHSQLTSDPQGTVYVDTTYDGLGLVYKVSNPYRVGTDITSSPGTSVYTYDSLGRKLTETYPDNSSVLTTAYCGPNILVTDPTKRWRRSRADGLGRMVEVDEPNSISAAVNSNGCPGTGEPIWVTSYGFDPLDDLTSAVQNGSHNRTFVYNSLKLMLTSTNPEVGTLTYTYDANGNVQTKRDGRGITTTYTYDVVNRELTRTYSDGTPTVTTTYDQPVCLGLAACQNIGHRTAVTDAAGSESWAYEVDMTHSQSIHVNQRTTSSITKTSKYYLDLAGNVTQMVYPTSRIVNYTFDNADRPITAVDASNGITYSTGFQTSPGGTCLPNITCYTPQGSIYGVSLGQTSSFTGVNITDSYNSRLQPGEFKASSTGGNAIDITYNFVDPINGGNAGHVFSISNNLNTSRTQKFTYDQLNRITSAGTGATTGTYCWGYQYTYDAWANLTSQAGWSPNYNGCTQTVMAAVTTDGNNHISAYSYDASGNATGETGYAYTWNGESQLITAGGVNYLYDGDGRRVAKVGTKLYWYGAGTEILAETNAAGNTLNEYIFFGGKRVALLPASATAQFYVEDSLGSSRIVTTNAGAVCYDADFYPFGGERAVTNSCTQNNYKFEGKERDPETGNDDFGARYYSNRFGRWLSADWSNVPVPVPYANLSNPQTLNLYSMVTDDPESFADLDGHLLSPPPESLSTTCPDNDAICMLNEQNTDRNSASQGSTSGQQQQAQNQAWSSLSSAQQALVQGGEKAWGGLSAGQQTNFAAITHALEVTTLSNGASGLSEVKSVTSIGKVDIGVTWNAGAKQAFKDSGFAWRPGWGHSGENGVTLGRSTTGLHLLFGDKDVGVGHAHIDYRGLGEGHYQQYNSDVRAVGPEKSGGRPISNYERYKSWFGPIPGYVP
jgi:RHS repeat-associated protein